MLHMHLSFALTTAGKEFVQGMTDNVQQFTVHGTGRRRYDIKHSTLGAILKNDTKLTNEQKFAPARRSTRRCELLYQAMLWKL